MKVVRICSLMLVMLLFAGCSRQSSSGGDTGKIPAALVSAAGGKAGFVEFYSPM